MSDITLSHVTVRRGPRAVLNQVNAHFKSRELTAVIGPNGAGKSTLLGVATGLLAPDSGEIMLGRERLAAIGRKELAQRRAFLPQRASAEWPISVERVVALGLTPNLPAFGGLPPSLLPAIDDALRECDLLAMRHRPVTALSGGELARTMFARAIVGDPEILIVDEPTAGLDPRHAIDVVRRLRERADGGRTVVMAIHDLDLVLRHADAVVALRDGQLFAAGTVAEVMTDAMLSALYDVQVRVIHDGETAGIRFLD